MNPISRIFPAALMLLAAAAPAATARQQRVGSISLGDAPARHQPPPQRSAVLARAYGASNLRVVPPPDVDALRAKDALERTGPQRIGVVVEFDPVLSSDGPWFELLDGGRLWTFAIRSAGARSLRLRFSDWSPPPGAEVALFSADGREGRGPLTDRYAPDSGVLWSHTVHSDHVRVEYYLPPGVDPRTTSARLRLDAISYNYVGPGGSAPPGGGPAAGGPLPCHLDWSCYADWTTPGQGVGRMYYTSASGTFFCSTGLLNRVPVDFAPLLSTAAHCGVTDANAPSVEVTWFYQTASCGGTAPSPWTLPSTLGCTLLAEDPGNDFALVGLRPDLPAGVTLLGWDGAELEHGESVVGIHHPAASWKRISFGTKPRNRWSCAVPTSGNRYEVEWSGGAGEGGSSGSPLFHAGEQLFVGVMSCGGSTCSSLHRYGRFDLAWPVLEPYLDPVDPVYADVAHTGDEQGTSGEPFDSILEASFAVIEGSTLYAEPGTYDESIEIERAMTLLRAGTSGSVVIR